MQCGRDRWVRACVGPTLLVQETVRRRSAMRWCFARWPGPPTDIRQTTIQSFLGVAARNLGGTFCIFGRRVGWHQRAARRILVLVKVEPAARSRTARCCGSHASASLFLSPSLCVSRALCVCLSLCVCPPPPLGFARKGTPVGWSGAAHTCLRFDAGPPARGGWQHDLARPL